MEHINSYYGGADAPKNKSAKDLSVCLLNTKYKIFSLDLLPIDIRNRLLYLGFLPGTEIKIIIKNYIYLLDIRRCRITISLDIAKNILVTHCE